MSPCNHLTDADHAAMEHRWQNYLDHLAATGAPSALTAAFLNDYLLRM